MGEGFHKDGLVFSIPSLILSFAPSQSTSLRDLALQLSCFILHTRSLSLLALALLANLIHKIRKTTTK